MAKVFTKRQLKRFVEISEIWEREKVHETPNTVIYAKYIENQYGIGITTFYKVLNIPAKRLLREITDLDLTTVRTDNNYNIILNN